MISNNNNNNNINNRNEKIYRIMITLAFVRIISIHARI